jgi:hypothetical protein
MSKRKKQARRGRKPEVKPPARQCMWVIMKAHRFDRITVMGRPLMTQKEGPKWFLPLFETREAAVKWNGGKDQYIGLVMTVAPVDGYTA